MEWPDISAFHQREVIFASLLCQDRLWGRERYGYVIDWTNRYHGYTTVYSGAAGKAHQYHDNIFCTIKSPLIPMPVIIR